MQPPIPLSAMEHAVSIAGREYVEAHGDACCVAPADAQQAVELLRFADANGLAVAIEGSCTKSGWLRQAPADICISTRRMDTVREHTWQDMTCSVEAGCNWQRMQSTLAAHGQHVALDPLWPDRATVGGVLGANDSGSLRLRYGGLRDLVIGMTVVLADGTIARSGGKVVKNVAGYDLPKLLCGSFGTLALITEVTFRLHAIAPHTSTLTGTAKSAEVLHELLLQVLNSQLSTQSMQIRTEEHGFALDIRLGALPQILASQQETLTVMMESLGVKAEIPSKDVWMTRASLFHGASMVVKATMLPAAIAATVQAIRDLGGSGVAQATGIVIASFSSDVDLLRLTQLRRQLEAGGGSLTVLIHAVEDHFDRWGTLPSSFPVMQAVKHHFDPNHILNRSRFLGGL